MQISCQKRGGVMVVALIGEIDAENVNDMLHYFSVGDCQNEWNVVLDLSRLQYIDSSGLGTFVKLMKDARKEGGDIRLANPLKEVQKVFELTRLNRVFDICEDVDSACERFCSVK